jgi:hypothetical protein
MVIAASLLRGRCTVLNKLLRMAGGQCPLKGGQLTTTTAMGELVNQLTGELTN